MISVNLHGANKITIKGSCLDEHSCIFLTTGGWNADIQFRREMRRPLERVEGKMRGEILPAIKGVLARWGEFEEFNDGEINSYLDLIQKRFK